MSLTMKDRKPKPNRRLRRWLWRSLFAILTVASGATLAGKLYLDRVEARAMLVAQTGIALNKSLKEFISAALDQQGLPLVALYGSSWTIRSRRDGTLAYEWDPHGVPQEDLRRAIGSFVSDRA